MAGKFLRKSIALVSSCLMMAVAQPANADIPDELYQALGLERDVSPKDLYDALVKRYYDPEQGYGKGAFGEVDRAAPVATLAYLRLTGGRTPLEWQDRTPKNTGVDELAAEALARTVKLFAGYENPQKGYLSRARVRKEAEMSGPYDHLARVREWALSGGEEE